jgi:hypothetical protein
MNGTLCITGEQGIGDEIMFASCVPDVMRLAERVIVECQPRLVPIFGRSFGVATYPDEAAVMAAGEKPAAQIPLGSLPMLFRNRAEDFPGRPFLQPDFIRAAKWSERMARLGPRPWIGVSWMGGTKSTRVHERSVDPTLLYPITARHTCVSLQYGRGAVEDAAKAGLPHFPEAAGNDEYEETLALVSVLDAVVTVSTTIFHAAGSLGVPAHVLVCTTPTWIHGIGQDAMPWYRSIKQHRQQTAGDWLPVIREIANELQQPHAARAA